MHKNGKEASKACSWQQKTSTLLIKGNNKWMKLFRVLTVRWNVTEIDQFRAPVRLDKRFIFQIAISIKNISCLQTRKILFLWISNFIGIRPYIGELVLIWSQYLYSKYSTSAWFKKFKISSTICHKFSVQEAGKRRILAARCRNSTWCVNMIIYS